MGSNKVLLTVKLTQGNVVFLLVAACRSPPRHELSPRLLAPLGGDGSGGRRRGKKRDPADPNIIPIGPPPAALRSSPPLQVTVSLREGGSPRRVRSRCVHSSLPCGACWFFPLLHLVPGLAVALEAASVPCYSMQLRPQFSVLIAKYS